LLLCGSISLVSLLLVGTKSLWTRAIHYQACFLYLDVFSCLFVTHNTTTENAFSGGWINLGLVSLMVTHAILRTYVHIRSTSWCCSHWYKHILSLFVSPSFIIIAHANTILYNLSFICHVILILISKCLNALNPWGELSSVPTLYLTHMLLALLLLRYTNYSTFLLTHSVLKIGTCFSHHLGLSS